MMVFDQVIQSDSGVTFGFAGRNAYAIKLPFEIRASFSKYRGKLTMTFAGKEIEIVELAPDNFEVVEKTSTHDTAAETVEARLARELGELSIRIVPDGVVVDGSLVKFADDDPFGIEPADADPFAPDPDDDDSNADPDSAKPTFLTMDLADLFTDSPFATDDDDS